MAGRASTVHQWDGVRIPEALLPQHQNDAGTECLALLCDHPTNEVESVHVNYLVTYFHLVSLIQCQKLFATTDLHFRMASSPLRALIARWPFLPLCFSNATIKVVIESSLVGDSIIPQASRSCMKLQAEASIGFPSLHDRGCPAESQEISGSSSLVRSLLALLNPAIVRCI